MGRSFTPAGGASTPFEGQELLSSFTPPPLPANTNDYTVNQRAFINASVLQIAATAAINLTGLQGANPNRELLLVNVGASTITLKNASGLSQAPNRFAFGADVALAQNQAIKLLGLAAGGWGLVGTGSSSGGPPAPSTATYVTIANESATLPDSVTLASLASGAFVYASAGQAIASGTPTALDFNVVLFDTSNYYNAASPTVLTAPSAGIYIVTASALWAASAVAGSTLSFGIAVNGDLSTNFGYNSQGVGGTVEIGQTVAAVLSLAAGDTVSANAIQNTGGNLNVTGIERATMLSIARIQ